MKQRHYSVTSFVFIVLPGLVLANQVEKVELTPGPPGVIDVYSADGTAWTNIDNSKSITFRATAYSKCKYMGENSPFPADPVEGQMSVFGFHRLTNKGTTEPYSSEVSGTYRRNNAEPDPVKVCNDELARRAGSNTSKRYELLKNGFNVNYDGAYKATYFLICKPVGLGAADTGEASAYLDALIRCNGSPDAKPAIEMKTVKATLAPLVTSASLTANPANFTGACPKGIAFSGSITATRAGEVKYQYQGNDGSKSPEFTLNFTQAGTRKTGNWNRTVNPLKDPAGQVAAAGTQDNRYDGWMQLRVLSPESLTRQANFSVTCGEALPNRAIQPEPVPSRATRPARTRN